MHFLKKLIRKDKSTRPSTEENTACSDELNAPLVLGKHYYIENGNYVFTEYYLKNRGYCCTNGCRHCPYPK